MEDLEKNFDDEKSRLLKTLSAQQDKMASERQRQIEMAKIKRDERLLQKGNKLSTVSTIINNAKDNEKRREQGYLPLYTVVLLIFSINIHSFSGWTIP